MSDGRADDPTSHQGIDLLRRAVLPPQLRASVAVNPDPGTMS
jgi:hypothetical protein